MITPDQARPETVDPETVAPESVNAATTKRTDRSLRTVLRRPAAAVSLAWILFLTLAMLLAPVLASASATAQDLRHPLAGPSGAHLLGTDSLGRDILSRLLYGGRINLTGVLIGVAVAMVLGATTGLLAGFVRRWPDALLSAIADILMSVPGVVVLLSVLAVFPQSMYASMTTFGVLASAAVFRVVRSATLDVSSELYVTAARTAGLRSDQILRRHVARRIGGLLIVQSSIVAALALVTQVGLGFLGVDIRPPQPSWGSSIQQASADLPLAVWPLIPSVIIVGLTILAFGLLGDTAQDVVSGVRSTARRAQRKHRQANTQAARLAPVETERETALSVRDLSVGIEAGQQTTWLVQGVSFDLFPGETVALVGESGSGKSVTARALLGLVPDAAVLAGQVRFHGKDLLAISEKQRNAFRGKEIAFIGQEPMVSLDPNFRIGNLLAEGVRRHRGVSRRAAREISIELLRTVRIPNPEQVARRYVHEVSGGMAQRAAIALALAGQPKVLIADEPTTALDVTVQMEILGLLATLQHEQRLSILIITHDWGVVADVGDRAVVMYAGEVVEQARVTDLFGAARHPYTRQLREADPHSQEPGDRLRTIPGTVPAPGSWPAGCRFAARCALAVDSCRQAPIPTVSLGRGQLSRCLRIDQLTNADQPEVAVTHG